MHVPEAIETLHKQGYDSVDRDRISLPLLYP